MHLPSPSPSPYMKLSELSTPRVHGLVIALPLCNNHVVIDDRSIAPLLEIYNSYVDFVWYVKLRR